MIEIVKSHPMRDEDGYKCGAHLPMRPDLYAEQRLTLCVDGNEVVTVQVMLLKSRTEPLTQEELRRLVEKHRIEQCDRRREANKLFEEKFGWM